MALWFRPKRIYTCEKARKIPKGGLLLIANHTDFADPVYMMLGVWQRRQYFLVSEELMDGPHGRLFKACRCIRIDRDNPGVSTFREITERLKSGECVSMCPEGKIAADSTKPSPFKSGAVLMAIRSGVPIIPMYIKKKKSAFGRLRIVIGESVDVRAGTWGLFHVSRACYQLFSNIEVRRGFAALGKALADPAVTGIRIVDRASGADVCTLTASEIEHLRMPQSRDVKLNDAVVTVALVMYGWLFTDGCQSIRAKMCDETFLRVVDNGILPIEPGMILIANMRVQSSQIGGRLVSDCSIMKVLDLRDPKAHIPMPGVP